MSRSHHARVTLALLTACFVCVLACQTDDVLLTSNDRASAPGEVGVEAVCAERQEGAPCRAGMHCASGRCVDDICGDGVRTGSESCDDGNKSAGDGCDPSCRALLTSCGNAVVDEPEECDDGNWYDLDGCSNVCTLNVCGNGRVDAKEECDDENSVDDDACSSACRVVSCRNGRLDPGEECDDADADDRNGCTNACKLSVCGNSKVEKYEVCDDGNREDGDDCPADCQSGAVCGDGILDPGEQCENARLVSTPGQPAELDSCGPTCEWLADAQDPCEKCQNEKCSNYYGIDLVDGCFHKVNLDYGADPAADPSFIQHCTDVVACALANRCGTGKSQAAGECYCGTASIDECASVGPGADAPCEEQWLAAALTQSNAEMQLRFSDLVFASGWAFSLIDCYSSDEFCAKECAEAVR